MQVACVADFRLGSPAALVVFDESPGGRVSTGHRCVTDLRRQPSAEAVPDPVLSPALPGTGTVGSNLRRRDFVQ
jgi:hypothetical protein